MVHRVDEIPEELSRPAVVHRYRDIGLFGTVVRIQEVHLSSGGIQGLTDHDVQHLAEILFVGGIVIFSNALEFLYHVLFQPDPDHEGFEDHSFFLEFMGDFTGIPPAGFNAVGDQDDDVPATFTSVEIIRCFADGTGNWGSALGFYFQDRVFDPLPGIRSEGDLEFRIVAILLAGVHMILMAIKAEPELEFFCPL